MIVRKLRLQRAWSQDQLAQLSGLSIRTIQRIERGQKAGLESMKALAAVFEIPLADLQQQEPDMPTNDSKLTLEESQVLEQVRDLKGFYTHLIQYLIVVGGLFILNLMTSPGHIWAWWVALGWGIGVASHALNVFEIYSPFGADWEKKEVEKKLGRKL